MRLFARAPVAGGRALTDPDTAAALRRYRQRSRRLCVGGLTTAVGAVLLAGLIEEAVTPAPPSSAAAPGMPWELINVVLGSASGGALLASVVGATQCARAHRLRRVLARCPWRLVGYRCLWSRRSVWPVLVWLDDQRPRATAPLVVRFALTWTRRLDPWQRCPTGTARLAGEPGGPMVLALPGPHERLYPIRAGRLAWTRRHWARVLQRHQPAPAPRHGGEHWGDEESFDSLPFDERPEYCWRCDAVPAANELGLCERCLSDLRARQRAGTAREPASDADSDTARGAAG